MSKPYQEFIPLTNVEAARFLKNKDSSKLLKIEKQVIGHIEEYYNESISPTQIPDSDSYKELMNRYNIMKTEMLEIANNYSPDLGELDLHVLVKKIEDRLSEKEIKALLRDIHHLF
mmetsp:Transcript_2454/g.2890  ORF Transcript_2454/g.2890 Transcript_2454/m.2890 type:complete len:116 (+) Transcript_2454:3-350(+)